MFKFSTSSVVTSFIGTLYLRSQCAGNYSSTFYTITFCQYFLYEIKKIVLIASHIPVDNTNFVRTIVIDGWVATFGAHTHTVLFGLNVTLYSLRVSAPTNMVLCHGG